MIYVILFWEFCKIGLLAIGGGLVTIPFLMKLTEAYDWFDERQLADMIAISESTPGPVGVNMATYGGFSAAGIWGGIVATLGLVFPSLVIIILISKYVMKYQSCLTFQNVLLGIRPAVLALILYAGYILAKLAVTDMKTGALALLSLAAVHRWRKLHPVVFIAAGAAMGVLLKL